MSAAPCHAECRFNAKWRKPEKRRSVKAASDIAPRARRADRIALAVVIGVIAWASGCMKRRRPEAEKLSAPGRAD